MLEIDGSTGEGGGQVLRTSLSLSCILGQEISISNIRAGRKKPGLSFQHLEAANAIAKICSGRLEGAQIGSQRLEFFPGKTNPGEYSFEIKTAGSAVLLAQAILPALALSKGKSTVRITGGTHVPFSPSFDYFSEVFLPAAGKTGLHAKAQIKNWGFYPTGGGEILLEVEDSGFSHADFLSQQKAAPQAFIVSSNLPPHVPEREKKEILKFLPEAKISLFSPPSTCPGNAITIFSGPCGSCAYGQRGRLSEEVASEACKAYLSSSPFGLDSHLADQLLIYLSLAKGTSSISPQELSSHSSTNMQVISKFLPGVKFIWEEGKKILNIRGIGK